MNLSIVIVSYNTCDELRNCLASLPEATAGLSSENILENYMESIK